MTDNNPSVLDNSENRTVIDFLKKVINDNYDNNYDRNGRHIKSHVDIVSAYFTVHAFNALKNELKNKVSNVRFILGEPSSIEKGQGTKTLKVFKIQDENIELDKVIQQNKIAKECYNWLKKDNVEVKTARTKDNKKPLIHGKMYYVESENKSIKENAVVGSSNFTSHGLGIDKGANHELNIIAGDNAKEDLKKWFNDLWEKNTEDAKEKILKCLRSIYRENSPEEVYYKTLYHLFEEQYKEDQENVEKSEDFVKTTIWKDVLYPFQRDAVNSIIKKLKKYNGCILADSVGLGKTYTALGVIQYFITHYKKPNILVLAPKKLEKNWNIYEDKNKHNPFKKDNLKIHVKTHSSLTSESEENKEFDWSDFDLVVIDESHNFRNGTTSKKDADGNIIKMSRYEKLLNKILKEGRASNVLLLSATPVNTNLSNDLYHQINLITGGNDYAFSSLQSLGIRNYKTILEDAYKKYIRWAIRQNRQKSDLLKELPPNFFKLLDGISIARSRKQIKDNYKDFKIVFPEREKPKSIQVDIDTKNEFPSFAEIDKKISDYSLSLFNPTKYLNIEYKKQQLAGNMSQADRETYLIGMMKAGFLKRLESSISSFTTSMKNTLNKIEGRIKLIDEYQEWLRSNNKNGDEQTLEEFRKDFSDFEESSKDINDDEELFNEFNRKLEDNKFTVGKKLQYSLSELNVEDWKKDLEEDYKKIKEIYKISEKITPDRDKKLIELKEFIRKKSKEPNKKILLFTTYADTAKYLYSNLLDLVRNELDLHIALVTGDKKRTCSTYKNINDYDKILENFSPCSKLNLKPEKAPKEQIDIIIATDCISEGQNLQDCDTVINYDIHWNPVRLIQRFGRIDRIGSNNSRIYMINFWPTKDLDSYINLKNRVESRMAAVSVSASADENLLKKSDSEEIKLLKESEEQDINYRDRQLKQIMEEQSIEGIEEDNSNIGMSDISMEDFREDLKNFIETKKKDLENMPCGISAIVPNKLDNGLTISEGIIFCFKQKGVDINEKDKNKENKSNNELFPYYMIYVQKDGTIRYSYAKSREILKIYKSLCLGKREPFMDLCHRFNEKIQTEDGMEFYNKILKSAADGIKDNYDKILDINEGLVPIETEQIKSDKDLELISWLVIENKD